MFPMFGGQKYLSTQWSGGNYGYPGVQVTAGGSAHTKGSWVEERASLEHDAFGFWLFQGGGGSNGDYLYDMSIGTNVIINNLIASLPSYGTAQMYTTGLLWVPIFLPKGSQIQFRSQCTTAVATSRIKVHYQFASFYAPVVGNQILTYGANTSDSGGISIDPGGTINTKGTWVEMVSSTPAGIKALALGVGSQNNTISTWATWVVDIGISLDGGTNKYVLIPDLFLHNDDDTDRMFPFWQGFFPINVPAGVKLYIRSACYINDATDRLFDAVLYAMR